MYKCASTWHDVLVRDSCKPAQSGRSQVHENRLTSKAAARLLLQLTLIDSLLLESQYVFDV